MKAISLFACGGIGDLGLRHAGFDVIVANELLEERAEVFKHNYPESQMIVGDIWDRKNEILEVTRTLLKGEPLDIVFATPPCQGMSKNGRGKLLNSIRQGLKDEVDVRNLLVIPAIDVFLGSGAHTLVMENVPEMENTLIPDPNNGDALISIIDFVRKSLGLDFVSSVRVVEFANYGVPQCRRRLISIFTKHAMLKKHLNEFGTLLPSDTHSKDGLSAKKWVTVRDVIANLPILDASRVDLSEDKSVPFHRVPLLDSEKYFWVSNTPEEHGAFDNQCINPNCNYDRNPTHGAEKGIDGINRNSLDTPLYCVNCGSRLPRPCVVENGQYRLMKGYTSAYKRMSWDAPASTLTRNFSYACSDNKLHPSQNRVLSLYEAMCIHTVSSYKFEWVRADNKKVSDKLVRELIGESIPPAGIEVIFSYLADVFNGSVIKQSTLRAQSELLLC